MVKIANIQTYFKGKKFFHKGYAKITSAQITNGGNVCYRFIFVRALGVLVKDRDRSAPTR